MPQKRVVSPTGEQSGKNSQQKLQPESEKLPDEESPTPVAAPSVDESKKEPSGWLGLVNAVKQIIKIILDGKLSQGIVLIAVICALGLLIGIWNRQITWNIGGDRKAIGTVMADGMTDLSNDLYQVAFWTPSEKTAKDLMDFNGKTPDGKAWEVVDEKKVRGFGEALHLFCNQIKGFRYYEEVGFGLTDYKHGLWWIMYFPR